MILVIYDFLVIDPRIFWMCKGSSNTRRADMPLKCSDDHDAGSRAKPLTETWVCFRNSSLHKSHQKLSKPDRRRRKLWPGQVVVPLFPFYDFHIKKEDAAKSTEITRRKRLKERPFLFWIKRDSLHWNDGDIAQQKRWTAKLENNKYKLSAWPPGDSWLHFSIYCLQGVPETNLYAHVDMFNSLLPTVHFVVLLASWQPINSWTCRSTLEDWCLKKPLC